MAFPFLALYLTRQMGYSVERAGLVVSVFGMGSLAVSPLSGWLCDRWGSLKVMVISLLATAVALVAFPMARSYAAVMTLTLVWAVVNQVFRPAAFTCVAEYVKPEQRKSAYTLIRLAVNLGMSIGPAAGGFLAQISFPLLFIVDATTTFVAALILKACLAGKANAPKGGSTESILSSLAGCLSDKRFVYFFLALIPVQIVFFQHESTMSLYLVRDLHFKESTFGLLFTINTAMILLFELQWTLFTGKWAHRTSIFLGSLLTGIGFGALAFTTGLFPIMATVVIWTLGEMTLLPAMSAYVSDIAPVTRRGAFMGLYSMGWSLAQVLAPLLGAIALERAGAPYLWVGCLAFGVISALMALRLRS